MHLDLFDIDSFLDDIEDQQFQKEALAQIIEKHRYSLPPDELVRAILEGEF